MKEGMIMIKVGLMGFGTVGTGVYKIIDSKKYELSKLLKEDIAVKKILVKKEKLILTTK